MAIFSGLTFMPLYTCILGSDDDPFVPLQSLFHGPQAVVIRAEFDPADLEDAPIIDDVQVFCPLIGLTTTSSRDQQGLERSAVTTVHWANRPGRRIPSGLETTARQRSVPVFTSSRMSSESTRPRCG